MQQKQKAEMFKSPTGIAVYPWLQKADTRFDPAGSYHTKLRLSGEDAQPLIDKITKMRDEEAAKVKAKTKKPAKEASLPFSPVYDDEGNETGDYEFNFKCKAVITTKDGKTLTKTVKIFDAKNKPIPDDVQVWGGSKIKVAFNMVPFATAIGVGVSLRLVAAQVIDLVEGGGGSSPFGEEEGYEAETKNNNESEDATEEDPDF